MNQTVASIRALLQQNPGGMGYDAVSRATGVKRDEVPAHIATLISAGDVRQIAVRGERLFQFSGTNGAKRASQADAPEHSSSSAEVSRPPAPKAERSGAKLHEHLFKTLEQLEAGTIDHVQAKARAMVADQIIKLAGVQLLYEQLKATKQIGAISDMPLIEDKG